MPKQSKSKSKSELQTNQSIHNFIVKNFGDISSYEYSKPMYLCGLLILCKSNQAIVDEFYSNDIEFKNIGIDEANRFFNLLIETLTSYVKKYPVISEMQSCLKPILEKGYDDAYGFDLIKSLIKLGKGMYQRIEKKEMDVIQNLFDQFFKYIGKNEMKNSEWTLAHTASVMVELDKIYEDISRDQLGRKIKFLEPCIGAGSLVNAFGKENLEITGYEVNSLVSNIATIDSIISDSYHNILTKDFIAADVDDEFDLTSTNPPFTVKVCKYNTMLFIFKAMLYSKHGIFIFPSSKLNVKSEKISLIGREILDNFTEVVKLSKLTGKDLETELKKYSANFRKVWKKTNDFKKFMTKVTDADVTNYLAENFHIDFIVNLGSGTKVFKEGSAGEIVIVAISKPDFKPFDETKYFDFPFDAKNVGKYTKQDVYYFTEAGKELFSRMLQTQETRDISPGVNWIRSGDVFYENCKKEKLDINDKSSVLTEIFREILASDEPLDVKQTKLIKAISFEQATVELIKTIKPTRTSKKEGIEKTYVDFSRPFNLTEFIPQDVLTLFELHDNFRKVKLNEIFEKVNGKSIKVSNITKQSDEYPYPIIGGGKFNNGISSYLDSYTYEASEQNPLWTIAKNGSIGTLFKQITSFNTTINSFALKPLIELEDINSLILTIQLTNMSFDFNNEINDTKFKKLEVYIYEP